MEGLQRAENPTEEYPNLIEIKWKQMEANGDEIPQARCPRLPAAPDSSPPQTPFRAPGSLPPQAPFRPSLPFAPASLPPQAPFRPRLLSARRAAARRVRSEDTPRKRKEVKTPLRGLSENARLCGV